MLAFTSPGVQSSLVVKSAATIRPGDRISVGREASLIVPRLYLANLYTAQDPEQLAALGVTHIVSVVEGIPKLPKSMPHLKTLHIPITDSHDADILQYLNRTTAFIKGALAEDPKNVVLVHCLVGMSRSATVVCAYLTATTSMVPSEAIGFVATKRCIVSPNPGFRQQLDEYAVRYHPKLERAQGGTTKESGGIVERLRSWNRRAT
ncbi:uncharacterized protein FIBRA_02273 [Fibroporia radiculosa]|uniref:Uncharacterized protein n=1 Tax=Fibroporia radiculosa TaxID=599839 RepID=J4H1R7_9APHY|nr:uncharacterized protein FIBRA_02273 [Fibroporia radiculosa]CCM00244.1 predicted protein [Fibroporia radiculosa]